MRSEITLKNLKLIVPVNLFERIQCVEKAVLLKKYMEAIIKLLIKYENDEVIEYCANGLLLSGVIEEMMKSNKNLTQTIQKSIALMDSIIANYKMTVEDFEMKEYDDKLTDDMVKELFGIFEAGDCNNVIILKNVSNDLELSLHLHGILDLAEKIADNIKIKDIERNNLNVDYYLVTLEKILSILAMKSITEDITVFKALTYIDYDYFENEVFEYIKSLN